MKLNMDLTGGFAQDASVVVLLELARSADVLVRLSFAQGHLHLGDVSTCKSRGSLLLPGTPVR